MPAQKGILDQAIGAIFGKAKKEGEAAKARAAAEAAAAKAKAAAEAEAAKAAADAEAVAQERERLDALQARAREEAAAAAREQAAVAEQAAQTITTASHPHPGEPPVVEAVAQTPQMTEQEALLEELRAQRESEAKAREEAAALKAQMEAQAAEAAALKAQTEAQAAEAAAAAVTYTVASGDSLWAIAAQNLGNGARWKEIYEANKDVIGPNPNLIHPGQVLTIPK